MNDRQDQGDEHPSPDPGAHGRLAAAVVAGVAVVALAVGGFLLLRGDDHPGTSAPDGRLEAFTGSLESRDLRCFDVADLTLRCYPRLAPLDEPSTEVEIDLVDDDSIGEVTVSAYGGTPGTGRDAVLDLGVVAGEDVFDLTRSQVLQTRPTLGSAEVDGATVSWASESFLTLSVPGFSGVVDDPAELPPLDQVRSAVSAAGLRCTPRPGALVCEARDDSLLTVSTSGPDVQALSVQVDGVGDVEASLRRALSILEPVDVLGPEALALVRSVRADTVAEGYVDRVHYESRAAILTYGGARSVRLSVTVSPLY